jgi:nicotinic acid mononucleotide adenylyltransferase
MSINYTPENTFIFSYVRMNPPTPGHLLLIETMINKAINLGVNKAYVITSSSLDGKNPLPCSSEAIPKPKNKSDAALIEQMQDNVTYKSSILNKMIQSYKQELINKTDDETNKYKISDLDVIVICSVGSPFGFINNVIKTDFIDKGISKVNIYFIVGRDRADFLDKIVEYYEKINFVNSIDGYVLERPGMTELKNTGLGEISVRDINKEAYSASFVRNLVKNGQKEDFTQVYSDYLSPDEIDKLYETIQFGTRLKSPPSKEEDENPESIYFDRGSLPIMGKNTTGGKKRRRNTKKRRKTKTRKNKRHTRRYK